MADTQILKEILEKISNIENRLTGIEETLEHVEKSSENMDQHIGFVEDIYLRIKDPFQSMIDWFQPAGYLQ
jgi:CII-binding regulator of phage lambda lysogenization HflD